MSAFEDETEVPTEIWLQLGCGEDGTHTWTAHKVDDPDFQEVGPYVRADRLSGRVTVTTADKARKLWALLDDIDTLDDACRDDDRAFRDAARQVQRRRFDIMTGEEWDAAIDTAPTPSPDQVRREALREAQAIALKHNYLAAQAIGALIAREGGEG